MSESTHPGRVQEGGGMSRPEALKRLCDEYGLDPENGSTTADEDIAPYLDGEEEIGQYVAVTESGEITYLYPCETLAEAKDKASANVGDSIYPEWPVEIIDLDTGKSMGWAVTWDD